MTKRASRRFFIGAISCATMVSGQSPKRCNVCNRRLPRKYWTYEEQHCCSQACIQKLRPRCSTCGNSIEGNYVEANKKVYCTNTCFEKTLPKCEICKKPIHSGVSMTSHTFCDHCNENSPACFSCGLPAAYPTRLEDGREVCVWCMRWPVTTQEVAQRNYEKALSHLESWTSLKIKSVPTLKLVDRKTMQQQSMDLRKTETPVSIRGLYSRQTFMKKRGLFGAWKESPKDTKETIYIIDHLNDEVFRVAAVHELMHDLIHEYFPHLEDAPLWVHEGISQQAAAEYCRRRNYVDVLQGIETCLDPDYGDGYHFINSITGFQGWSALRKWIETVDVESLPATAPKRLKPLTGRRKPANNQG